MYYGVLFDFAGTLFSLRDMRKQFREVLIDVLEKGNVQYATDDIGAAYKESIAKAFIEVGGTPFYYHRDLFKVAFINFLDHFGAENTEELSTYGLERQTSMAIQAPALRSSVLPTLKFLKESGISTAIVSNIDNDHFYPMLERLDLFEHVDFVISSEEACSCKPDPKIFNIALDNLKLEPYHTLFVGDTPFADIEGAKSLNMATALINEKSDFGLKIISDREFQISDIKDIVEIVRGK